MKNKIIKYSICISALILIIFLYFGKLPVIKLNGSDFINIEVNNKYKDLGERTYNCKCCKNELDRDFNASINIMFEGLKLYMENYEKNYAII